MTTYPPGVYSCIHDVHPTFKCVPARKETRVGNLILHLWSYFGLYLDRWDREVTSH